MLHGLRSNLIPECGRQYHRLVPTMPPQQTQSLLLQFGMELTLNGSMRLSFSTPMCRPSRTPLKSGFATPQGFLKLLGVDGSLMKSCCTTKVMHQVLGFTETSPEITNQMQKGNSPLLLIFQIKQDRASNLKFLQIGISKVERRITLQLGFPLTMVPPFRQSPIIPGIRTVVQCAMVSSSTVQIHPMLGVQ